MVIVWEMKFPAVCGWIVLHVQVNHKTACRFHCVLLVLDITVYDGIPIYGIERLELLVVMYDANVDSCVFVSIGCLVEHGGVLAVKNSF